MSRKLSYDEVKDYIKVNGFNLLDNFYCNIDSKLTLSDREGYKYYISFYYFRKYKSSSRFGNNNPYTIQNMILWLKANEKPFELLSDIFFDSNKTKLKWKCLNKNCEKIFEAFWSQIYTDNYNCPYCNQKHKHKDYKFIKEFVNKLGFELLNNIYINSKSKLRLKDDDGYLYLTCYADLNNGYMPQYVFERSPYSILNIKHWIKLNNKYFELLSDKYVKAKKLLKWKCLKEECGETFEMSWDCIQRGQECPYCSGKKVGISNCLATKRPDLAIEWHPTKNGDLTPFDVTCGTPSKYWWLCQNCKSEWYTSPNSRTNRNSNCPICAESLGEKKISEILNNKDIIYTPQKTFNNLTGLGGGLLSYDFYLLEYSLLIEYQGQFHDGTAYQQTEEDLKKQKEHDRRKRLFALEHNIRLLEIWYWEFDDIEEVLVKELNKISKKLSQLI